MRHVQRYIPPEILVADGVCIYRYFNSLVFNFTCIYITQYVAGSITYARLQYLVSTVVDVVGYIQAEAATQKTQVSAKLKRGGCFRFQLVVTTCPVIAEAAANSELRPKQVSIGLISRGIFTYLRP